MLPMIDHLTSKLIQRSNHLPVKPFLMIDHLNVKLIQMSDHLTAKMMSMDELSPTAKAKANFLIFLVPV